MKTICGEYKFKIFQTSASKKNGYYLAKCYYSNPNKNIKCLRFTTQGKNEQNIFEMISDSYITVLLDDLS